MCHQNAALCGICKDSRSYLVTLRMGLGLNNTAKCHHKKSHGTHKVFSVPVIHYSDQRNAFFIPIRSQRKIFVVVVSSDNQIFTRVPSKQWEIFVCMNEQKNLNQKPTPKSAAQLCILVVCMPATTCTYISCFNSQCTLTYKFVCQMMNLSS